MRRLRRRPAPVDKNSAPLCHIDFPPRGASVAPGWMLVRGWVAAPPDVGPEPLTLRQGDARVVPRQEPRPDLEGRFPDRRTIGFREFIFLSADRPDPWTLEVATPDGSHSFPLPFSVVEAPGSRSPTLPFEWCLDSPRGGPEPTAHSVVVQGWLVLPRSATLEEIFVHHGARVPVPRIERLDVAEQYADDQVVGFRGLVELSASTNDKSWSLHVRVDGCEYQADLPVTISTSDRDGLLRRKAAKLEKIEVILRCPTPLEETAARRSCGGKLERIQADCLRCVECSASYRVSDRNFDLLSNELRQLSGIRDTANISCLPYKQELSEFVEQYTGGLILDNGSGLRDVYHDNVVNLEVVDYLTTDVLGVGEHLPFADDSFDALISIAVLEHVRNPFVCASEIARVVKPGGEIFVEVPFLQPYHGYPHHYYNMTRSGLENLFSDRFVIERAGIPRARGGEPIFTLPWLLGSYVAGLPRDVAERFKQLTVGDLLAEGSTFLDQDFVTELDPQTADELAHVTYVVARKR